MECELDIKDIKNYDELIDIIYDNESLIEKNYKSKKDQIVLHKELLVEILYFLKSSEYDSLDKKELIKELVRDVLNLNSGDLILIKKEYIFIKLYDESARKKVAQNEVDTVASRFNGIDEAELKSFCTEYFSKDEVEMLFEDIASVFVEKYFLDTFISNGIYERDIFKIIQKLIIVDISSEFECSLEFYKGFSGYIFRKNFKLVFKHIAYLLLKEVAYSNPHVMDFLKYYSLNIVVNKGIKYKIPELISDDGLKWHIVSIIAMVKTYIKIQDYIVDKEESLKKLKKEILSMYIDEISPVKHNAKNLEQYKKLVILIKRNATKIEHSHDALDICKVEEESTLIKKELEELQDERSLLRENKADLQAKKVKLLQIEKYNGLLTQIEVLEKESKAKRKILKKNQDSFESIQSALVNALTSKKKVI